MQEWAENEMRISETGFQHFDSDITNNLARPAEELKLVQRGSTRDEEALEIIARALEGAEYQNISDNRVPLSNSMVKTTEDGIKGKASKADEEKTEETKNQDIQKSRYTFHKEKTTMYATVELNVRNKPSKSGEKVGLLKKNQEVLVTGKCNETGWYRIQYGDDVAYVSNQYVSKEKKEKQQETAQASKEAVLASQDSVKTGEQTGTVTVTQGAVVTSGYDRAMAEQIFALVNQERAAIGAAPLNWDENMYQYACSRAKTIVSDFSHDGCEAMYGENILMRSYGDECAQVLYQQWKDSPGHHTNYLDGRYDRSGIAVYVVNGQYYAVQNFALAGF